MENVHRRRSRANACRRSRILTCVLLLVAAGSAAQAQEILWAHLDAQGNVRAWTDYRAQLGRFTTVDPAQNWSANLSDPQRWNRYAYARNNPFRWTDPDGRDAIPVAFPNFQVATPLGRLPYLGHAGIILVNGHTGSTRYYEYGRYDSAGLGLVRRKTVPDVTIGKDGTPTDASLKRLFDAVSRQSGQGGPVEGAYVKSDTYDEMVSYARTPSKTPAWTRPP